MPPVFGPRSPSASRLWSRDSGQRQRLAAVAQRDQAGLAAVEPLLDHDPGARRVQHAGDRRLGLGQVVADRHALPGRQPVVLDDDPCAVRVERPGEGHRRIGILERCASRHADAGRGRDLVAERLAALDPRGGGGRAEDRDPRGDERIGHAGRQRRLRPDDDQLDRLSPCERDHRGPVERVDVGAAHPRLAGDGVAPRGDDHLVDARLRPELPGQRVLAAAAPHDEDPGRHQQAGRAHAGIPARFRIGRQARSMVCVRSGPTDSSTIGTPACASMALT